MPKDLHSCSKRWKYKLIRRQLSKCSDDHNENRAGGLQNVTNQVATSSTGQQTKINNNGNVESISDSKLSIDNLSENFNTFSAQGEENSNDTDNCSNSSTRTSNEFDSASENESSASNLSQSSVRDAESSSLKGQLRSWTVDNNITHSAVNKLLVILRQHGFEDLPSDSRTLLQTPRLASNYIISKNGGRYVHFGLAIGIQRSIKEYFKVYPYDVVKINLNVDGLPLSRSSKSQFWPVMASIEVDGMHIQPFFVGIHHGFTKPNNANELLQPFVDEMIVLQANGINVDGTTLTVRLNAILCDAPAKAFVSYIKYHSGYFSCSKCIQEGDYVSGRVTYPDINSTLRSDESFRLRVQPDHHTGDSILELLGFEMVLRILLDYMHLVCLGVVKRLLQFFVKGKKDVRFNADILAAVVEHLLSLGPYVTTEFARKPRNLNELENWKATEFRQFLLYTGPIVLKNMLPEDMYQHFLCLSIAVRILTDNDLCHRLNNYAQSLLEWFVKNYSQLYGAQYVTYNVHNLIHLADQVKEFGSLDKHSCFKYENEMQKIKKMIKKSGKPLEEITNRLYERNQSTPKTRYRKKYPIAHVDNKGSISQLIFETFTITKKQDQNNYCMLDDGTAAAVHDIFFGDNDLLCVEVKCFLDTTPFLNSPCDSKMLGICVVSSSHVSESMNIPSSRITRKCSKFKSLENDNMGIIVPLLHSNNN